MIDSFEVGDFNIVDAVGGLPTLGEQSGLPTSQVFGGVRLVSVRTSPAGTSPTISTALLQTQPVLDDAVQMTTTAAGTFRFIYDGIAGGNTASGSAGALGLDLSSNTSILLDALNVVGAPTVRIRLSDSMTSVNSSLHFVTSGTNSVNISSLGLSLDLSDIRQLEVTIGTTPGNVFDLSSIRAVPEPGTALLVGGGFALLAVRRRRATR